MVKAAILSEYRKFTLSDTELKAPGPSEIQVRIRYASICGTDMHIFNGDFHPRTPVPFIPGHEMGGIVQELGENIKDLIPGDKVAIDPIIWCGECDACKAGHFPACSSLKLIGIDLDGGFAEMVNVPDYMIHKADPRISDMHIALTEIYSIGFHACKRAGLTDEDTLAIWGAGRVGNVILQAARTLTSKEIFLVDTVEERLDIARKHYKNVVCINALNEDPVEVIKERTGSRGVDIAFEAVGHAAFPDRTIHPVRGCIQSIKGGGKVCVLGLADDPAPIVFKELIWKEARIIA